LVWLRHNVFACLPTINIVAKKTSNTMNGSSLTAAMQLAHPNTMLQRLKAGEVVSAMSIRYSRGIEIVGYAKASGMDGVLVDLEHRSVYDAQYQAMFVHRH
jgi:hypothetical protein